MRTILWAPLLLAMTCGILSCAKKGTDSAGGAATVFEESFTGSDGATFTTTSWNISAMGGASFDISANRGHPQQAGGPSPSALYATLLDQVGYLTTVDLIVSGGAYSGDAFIIAKSQSATTPQNSYMCGLDGATGKVLLASVSAGTGTQLAISSGTAGPLPDGATATLKFDVETTLGVSMICTLTLNGTDYTATAADSTFQNPGYWGLFGGKTGANFLYFDNFKITN